jgi:4-hydroxy-L-threonine phosphate dehydrogenase PdxA
MREELGIYDYENLYEGIAPEDFVSLFANASFVITTSFHGTAFAINYNKPFYAIYDPDLADDRIISLLRLLGIEDRAVSIHQKLSEVNSRIDYRQVNDKLNSLKNDAFQFLRENL